MKLVEMSDIFSVSYGHKLDLNKMTKSHEGVAFINRTAKNNGVVAHVAAIPGFDPAPAGALTIALGGSVLSTFLQVEAFYTGQNVAIAIPKVELSSNQCLYYATAIKANRFRYSTCGREANRTFRSLLIPHPSEIPAWVNQANVEMYDGAGAPYTPKPSPDLATSRWQPVKLLSMFSLRKGKRLTKANMTIGNIPFIGSTDSKNGITAMIGQTPIHDGNTISVSYNGSVAEAFYQPTPFWATDDVNVLYPNFDMTPAIALFLCTVIRQEKYRFNYGRKWHLERMEQSVIKLPTAQAGQPDWDFMENYVKTLPFSSQLQEGL